MVYAYFSDLSEWSGDAIFEAVRADLSPFRREKADRCRFRKDRDLCLGAGFLLDAGLKRYGLREKGMEYAILPGGKPYWRNAPQIRFSISHSADKVMVCFSDSDIGCDIERVTAADRRIAKRFFHPAEYAKIEEQTTEEAKNDTFFRLWTLKESYLKATGNGLSAGMDSFEVRIGENGAFLTEDTRFRFWEPDVFPGFRASFCTADPSGKFHTEYHTPGENKTPPEIQTKIDKCAPSGRTP